MDIKLKYIYKTVKKCVISIYLSSEITQIVHLKSRVQNKIFNLIHNLTSRESITVYLITFYKLKNIEI